jgi:hypothetical protein
MKGISAGRQRDPKEIQKDSWEIEEYIRRS